MKTLCIDIGATRIKAAIIDRNFQISDLNGDSLVTMRSLGWLNKNLGTLLLKENWAGLSSKASITSYDDVAIGLCSKVGKDGSVQGRLAEAHVPKDLQECLSRSIGNKPVKIINDAEAWLRGAIKFSLTMGKTIHYPCLALTFGTGVGYAWADSANKVESCEFGVFPWKRLKKAAGFGVFQTGHQWPVHAIMGKSFFDWVEKNNPDWSYYNTRDEFTMRFVALIKDIADEKKKPETIIIGGGNAEYVSVRQSKSDLTNTDIVCIRRPEISINPDYIPLLGLL